MSVEDLQKAAEEYQAALSKTPKRPERLPLSDDAAKLVLKEVEKLPANLLKLLKEEPRCYIAGGWLSSLLAETKTQGDIDIFIEYGGIFPNSEKGIEKILRLAGIPSHKGVIAWNAQLESGPPIQFIFLKPGVFIEDVIDSFDFTVCQVYAHFHSVTDFDVYGHRDCVRDNHLKRLRFAKTKNLHTSPYRAFKYVERGYHLSHEHQNILMKYVVDKTLDCVGATNLSEPEERARIKSNALGRIFSNHYEEFKRMVIHLEETK